MNYIRKVQIDNFWGDKKVVLEFTQNENFLIGVNGSGKTTIINLIASAINADFITLDRIEFKKITIYLTPYNSKVNKTKIIVTKTYDEYSSYNDITFDIYKGREKYRSYDLNSLQEERLIRNKTLFTKSLFHNRKDLDFELAKLFNTSWLSINRTNDKFRRIDENSFESLIDLKLSEFNHQLSGYLAELSRKANEETDKFQKEIFLSLLATESENALLKTIERIDVDKEANSLKEIYKLFNLKPSEYQSKLDNYIRNYKAAKKKIENSQLNFIEAEYLIGVKRIHTIIDKWKLLLNEQENIFSPKKNFIEVINQLFQRKEIRINERNQLYVTTQSGKEFSVQNLSSGEKQLLIIFGEALLQRQKAHIFIADEPELSLHVEWQEKLVSSLKILNPFAQLIFATHSPDIVGSYYKSVLQIEKCYR
ncbi:AAA family ATPase [Flavobacterium sp.]|jgi:energy-coupling factor transporter ATP-binding protein EcfA2|uniref:AAA family ATPase n=1 Tax=Flavobacterium sp. TaxID=239 RepID=UPI0035B3853E